MHVDKYICDKCKKKIVLETLPHDFRIKNFLSDNIEGHFCDSCVKQFMLWLKEV